MSGLRFEIAQLRGRIDFLTTQLRIIKDNPYTDENTRNWCDTILKVVENDPIPSQKVIDEQEHDEDWELTEDRKLEDKDITY